MSAEGEDEVEEQRGHLVIGEKVFEEIKGAVELMPDRHDIEAANAVLDPSDIYSVGIEAGMGRSVTYTVRHIGSLGFR